MGRHNVGVSVVDTYGRDKSCKIMRQCSEADFVATLGSSRCCVQSASSIDGPEKRERGDDVARLRRGSRGGAARPHRILTSMAELLGPACNHVALLSKRHRPLRDLVVCSTARSCPRTSRRPQGLRGSYYLLSPAYSSSSVTRQRSALSAAALLVAALVSLLVNRTK